MTTEHATLDTPAAARPSLQQSNAYAVFILILTFVSLAVMVALVLPLPEATTNLLLVYDNAICVVFLLDFAWRLKNAPDRKAYFIGQNGWLDLIGSMPALGVFRFTALLRLARIARVLRISRRLGRANRRELLRDFIVHRTQYALFLTTLIAVIVMLGASVTVLNAETRSDDANIKTGWDAIWWSFVTITTVGYGDRFPVTATGRIGAMFVMLMGIGVIGALASILASFLVGGADEEETDNEKTGLAGVTAELAALRAEVALLRASLESSSGAPSEQSAGPEPEAPA